MSTLLAWQAPWILTFPLSEQKKDEGDESHGGVWKEYKIPGDPKNCLECADVDAHNREAWEYNRARLKSWRATFKLLKNCGEGPIIPPPQYVKQLHDQIYSKMYEPEFMFISAVSFLKFYGLSDKCALEDSVEYAQKYTAQQYIKQKLKNNETIDLTFIVGAQHAKVCACENKWDGRSKECAGLVLHIQWKMDKKHHFLRPCVVPHITY